MNTLAIDPGKRMGWAVFGTDNVMRACGEWDGDEPALGDALVYAWGAAGTVVVELPYHYPHGAGGRRGVSVDPNNLIKLAARAGLAAGRSGWPVRWISPNDWKAQVPKPIHHARIASALLASEIGVVIAGRVSAQHPDMWDAIGLGLFAMGRLGRGGK